MEGVMFLFGVLAGVLMSVVAVVWACMWEGRAARQRAAEMLSRSKEPTTPTDVDGE